jgi:Leucine-rich repeat (LRR) protein
MLNASFCGVVDITGDQAVQLQDRNMTLRGNPWKEMLYEHFSGKFADIPVKGVIWDYEFGLRKVPAWLRTLETVTVVDLSYCDVKEIRAGMFPPSLELLLVTNQGSGLRLHADSFEGLPNLRWLWLDSNRLTEEDMHPGLFGETNLEDLHINNNGFPHFDAEALFPGSSGQTLERLDLRNGNLTSIGGDSETNFRGLTGLVRIYMGDDAVEAVGNHRLGEGIAADAFEGLTELGTLSLTNTGLTALPEGVFSGECAGASERRGLGSRLARC